MAASIQINQKEPLVAIAVAAASTIKESLAFVCYSGSSMEHRAERHQKLYKAGKLEFAGHTADCTVRSLSDGGATIELLVARESPNQLTLRLLRHKLIFRCLVVWRDRTRLGVVFEPSPLFSRDCDA